MRRLTGKNEIVSRIDKRDVRESLRKIAGEAFRSRVVFLGQKPDIVAQAGKSFEKPARIGDAAEHQKAIGKPEAAGQKRAFARRQPIVRFFGVVAQNETLGREARARWLPPCRLHADPLSAGNQPRA